MYAEVAAALIRRENRFLIGRRPQHKARGGLWEFVGGKLEPGETGREALIRECHEELAVTVRAGAVYLAVDHAYPDITIRLTLYEAVITEGEPQLLAHSALCWITPDEIPQYDFCPADRDILAHIHARAEEDVRSAGIRARLLALQDTDYRAFQCRLVPTVPPDTVLGVRTPALRALARELAGTPAAAAFLTVLPHRCYEENNLHGFLIERLRDYDACVAALHAFLPYVDNWATCDQIRPRVFIKNLDRLPTEIRRWLDSGRTYTVRFGIEMLMTFYLDGAFSPEHPALVAAAACDEYYVNMMIAWYFATALAKQWDAVLPYLTGRRLPLWVHNKTIQKATESYRITREQKTLLRGLRIK